MEWVEVFLQQREEQCLLRTLKGIERAGNGRVVIGEQEFTDFSSNDYLGLSGHPLLVEQSTYMAETYGVSSSASRLMSGDLTLHHTLERNTADFKGKEASLVFGSGYLANIGVIPAMVGKGDVVFSDSLNHASIVDGCTLSKAQVICFNHNDTEHLKYLLEVERAKFDKALIVAESVYSMDGDYAPLNELAELKERHNAYLMLDEAHATGIFGKNGSGLVEQEGLIDRVDLIMGTYGKALGSYGAYVAASQKLVDYLVNKARSFVYSTALPPSVIGASLAAMEVAQKEPSRRTLLLKNADYFRGALRARGLITTSCSQIVPILVGTNQKTMEVAHVLRESSIFALPIRPPTVTEGQSRIRFSLTIHHTREMLDKVTGIIQNALAPAVAR